MNPRSRTGHSTTGREISLESFPSPGKRAVPVFAGYPAPYRIGMSNLGFHFLFGTLSRAGIFKVERFFSDSSPLTIESGMHLSSAVALFFSISYEEDYLNLARILIESGIDPLRRGREKGPLIIVGGPAVSSNPLPLAEIADAAALGEGEGSLEKMMRVIAEAGGAASEDTLEELSKIDGVFVPGMPGKKIEISGGTKPEDFPHSIIITPDTVFSNTMLLETARGCPGSCAFCLATNLYRPYRYLPSAEVVKVLDRTGGRVKKVGLVSTAITAHPEFASIVAILIDRGIEPGFGSLRAGDIDAEKAELIGSSGTRSATLAPESGSERVRFLLGKREPDETYFRAAAGLRERGIRNFNVYLLEGCPGGTDAASAETALFAERFVKSAAGATVTFHVNILIPKPGTPLQSYPLPPERELSAAMGKIKKICRGAGGRVRLKSVRSSIRQAVLSLGDERVGMALVDLASGGISWKGALRKAGVDPSLPHMARENIDALPWYRIVSSDGYSSLLSRYRAVMRSAAK